MAEHPNAEPIRRAFDGFAHGDMATMRSLVDARYRQPW
jgi:ketosteroid isomerase-like protein